MVSRMLIDWLIEMFDWSPQLRIISQFYSFLFYVKLWYVNANVKLMVKLVEGAMALNQRPIDLKPQ